MKEGYLIEKYFKPLAKNFSDSLALSDDAAILKILKNQNLVISVDNFIYGVHCPDSINISHAIYRAILIAVSDLSAMAAKPYCIFLALNLKKDLRIKFFEDLQKGIKKALESTETELAGGDLCSSRGPISFSITAVGEGRKKTLLKRKGAKPGQLLCVSGNIGDAKIGLDSLLKNKKIKPTLLKNYFVKKFLYPPLRSNFSRNISQYVSSCIDISDGLLIDVSKLAKNSNCGLEVFSKDIPISMQAKKILKKKSLSIQKLISAGDDYELAFSVNRKNFCIIKEIAKKNNTKISVIGKFNNGNRVLLDNKNFPYGYSHF